ncbi:hypothetical protein M426DRAFT_262645 [Hypoxylon sp. CI-4A]|nr:hypothetical protein M426DRAFT_262645 [Hypoxylon sp. CI-4A]
MALTSDHAQRNLTMNPKSILLPLKRKQPNDSLSAPVPGPKRQKSQASHEEITRGLNQLSLSHDNTFTLFSKLPPELRRKIWRETWEERDVDIHRKPKGISNPDRQMALINKPCNASLLRQWHKTHTNNFWNQETPGPTTSRLQFNTETSTNRTNRPPMSLWVNKESRHETLLHFENSFHMPHYYPFMNPIYHCLAGHSFVFFNFDLDTLVYPIHSPLSTSFSQQCLSKVVRIVIPESWPNVRCFGAIINGPQRVNILNRALQAAGNRDKKACHKEFNTAWRFLRRWFPSLREITLAPWHTCRHYEHSMKLPFLNNTSQINNPTKEAADGSHMWDKYCSACKTTQYMITGYLNHLVGRNHSRRVDLHRLFARYHFVNPISKQETMVIGRVPGEKEGQEEDVTVTFTAMYERFKDPVGEVTIHTEKKDWDVVKREYIATSLVNVFGPPTLVGFMTYDI